jgi:hypothetical protein
MDSIDNFSPKYYTAVVHVSTDGIPVGIKLADGKERVSATPYGIDVAEGNIANHTNFYRPGYNPSVGTSEQDVWGIGGAYTFPPSSGGKVSVVSTNNVDNSTGSGVQQVVIDYLDTNWAAQSTVLSLNGTSTVDTDANDIMRVNSFRVSRCGTGGVAAGTITCHATSGATPIYRYIIAGNTRPRAAIYTVPLGKQLYITDIGAGVGASVKTAARFALRANYDPGLSTNPLSFQSLFWEQVIVDQGYVQHFTIPLKFAEKTDIKMSVYTNQSSGVICQCGIRGWQESSS